MAALASFHGSDRTLVLSHGPVPIVVTRGALAPVAVLAGGFAAWSVGAGALLVLGAALLGGLGGALSLIVHELGHVRAARPLESVRAKRVSLIWLGAATQFEGAYENGREQMRVALGGPAASIAFAFALALAAVPLPHDLQFGCFGLALLNLTIGVATLLPVNPLDGYKLVVGAVWWVVGGETRARLIVRRLGFAFVGLDAVGSCFLLVEKPLIGGPVVAMGAAAYGQKLLLGRRR
jgi:Zn-dependent protease